jgi:hypothetical protein
MSSSDWIAKFNKEKDASPAGTRAAITAYGKCYDARTSRLAASLGKSGKGPLMGARGNFNNFEKAVQDFTTKALADSESPAEANKAAYASLYEKQFRYQFYESYVSGTKKAASLSTSSGGDSQKNSDARKKEAPVADSSAASGSSSASQNPDDAVASFSKAKNRFGELLGALPGDKAHEIHAAFGKILSAGGSSEETRFAVYRYAIFLLEPPEAKPFSPPPF